MNHQEEDYVSEETPGSIGYWKYGRIKLEFEKIFR